MVKSKQKLSITKHELLFTLSLAFLGFVFSAKEWIQFMDGLDPIGGLLLYYGILYTSIYILSRFGLIIWKFNIKNPKQVLGATLITFAFFILVNWESCYVQQVTGKMCMDSSISQIFFQSEDGAVYYFWNQFFHELWILRILTFVLTPAILALIGVLLVSEVKLSPGVSG